MEQLTLVNTQKLTNLIQDNKHRLNSALEIYLQSIWKMFKQYLRGEFFFTNSVLTQIFFSFVSMRNLL